MKFKKYSLLGISFHALKIDELNSIIDTSISNDEKNIIANHNLHSLYIYHHNKIMRDFYEQAKFIHIDGMAIVLFAKLFGHSVEKEHRVTYVDWVKPLMSEAELKEWRIYFVGSKPGVGAKAIKVLTNQFPKLMIKEHHGYFNSDITSLENKKVLKDIESFKPHIVMVGMGMPRQENWILENSDKINANIILPSGACMDYVAGEVPTPPRWLGKIGLEWFYRLISDPKRLWKRYLLEPFFIVHLLIKEIITKKSNRIV